MVEKLFGEEKKFEIKMAAVKRLFEQKGWDERVPELIREWGESEVEGHYNLDCGKYPEFSDIDLSLFGEDNRVTKVSTLNYWRAVGFNRRGGAGQLEFEGEPITSVRAIKEGDEGFDGDEKIEFALPEDGLALRINKSGKIEFVSKQE